MKLRFENGNDTIYTKFIKYEILDKLVHFYKIDLLN